MNRKGQVEIGALLTVAVAVIVGLAMFTGGGGIASNIGDTQVASAASGTNVSITSPAAGGTLQLLGQDIVGTATITNTSGYDVANNFTTTPLIGTDGLKHLYLTTKADSIFGSKSLQITYNYVPEKYIQDSGARSIANIIVIFAALAIAVIALSPTLRSGLVEFGR